MARKKQKSDHPYASLLRGHCAVVVKFRETNRG
jgi:hypothetical protein